MRSSTLLPGCLLAVLSLALLSPAAQAQSPTLDDLRATAQACEKRGDWLVACKAYDEILRRDRTVAESREAYQRCLRHFHQARRHRDPNYRKVLARLTPSQALDLYEQVLSTVAATHVDRARTELNLLFQQGVREVRFALDDEAFAREHLAGSSQEALEAFKAQLDGLLERKLASRAEAREQVLATARLAQKMGVVARASLLTPVLALEFAAGACNALDEYTLFLTPASYCEMRDGSRGKSVSVGIEVAAVDGKLAVTRVYPRSPAAEAGVLRHDRIVRIDRLPGDGLPPDLAAERLRGEEGSAVELEVVTPGQMMSRSVKLSRRTVVAPTVDYEMMPDDMGEAPPVGLVRIFGFQESTVQEVTEALVQLRTEGMKALVLDLRGNPGGLFHQAVQVAELFLGEGVIVYTQGSLKEYNRPYRADLANPLTIPMVVLVDGETASAAEVVAGALKELNRATLVGQMTFGKGTIQRVFPLEKPPLDKTPGGIRITVAKFFSPTHQPYHIRGVSPDIPITAEGDAALAFARQTAQRMLLGMMR